MGEVFRGFDERLNRPVALKRIRPERADSEGLKRFRREAQAAAGLSHRAVVQVHDWLEDASGAWIVMELVNGQSLRSAMAGAMEIERILSLGVELASGLGAAHRAGLVHRDFKPENVMLGADGQVKILDFGLAKRAAGSMDGIDESSLTADHKIVGTFSAMSPEQALGRELDARSDLFALGSLLYEMLAGAAPFRGATAMETLTRICTHDPTPLIEARPEISTELSDLVDDLLAKDPALRPADAAEVETSLRRLLQGSGSTTGPLPVSLASDTDEATREATAAATMLSSSTGPEIKPEDRISTESAYRTDFGGTAPRIGKSTRWAAGIALVLGLVTLATQYEPWASDSDGESAVPEPSAIEEAADTPAPVDFNALEPHELYAHGRALLKRPDRAVNFEAAGTAFQRILDLRHASALGYTGLAELSFLRYRDLNRDLSFLTQARAAADRAIELDPYFVDALVIRAAIAAEQGADETADEDLAKALILQSDHAEAHYWKGRILSRRNETEAAESAFREALESAPGDRRIHDDFGAMLIKLGRYDEAEQQFLESIRLEPDLAFGRRNLAAIYYLQGRFDEAAKQIQAALKIKNSPDLYSNLGTLLFIQGLYHDAVDAFSRALEVGSSSNDYLIWANLADAQRWASKPDEAEASYRTAIRILGKPASLRPEDVTLKSRLALYSAKAGDQQAAVSFLNTLESREDLDPSALYRMAVAYEVIDQRDKAMSKLAEAVSQGYSRAEIERDPELQSLRVDIRFHHLWAE